MSSATAARSWWAVSRTRSRVTALAATALVLILGALSVVVWTSPEISPVQQTIRAAEEVQKATGDAHEREKLMARIDALEAQVASLGEGKADAEQALAENDGALQAALRELALVKDAPSGRNGAPVTSPQPAKPAPAPAAAPVTAPSKAELVAPAAPYYGMYTEQAPHNWATFDATSAKVGALPSMVGYFGGWDQDFRSDAVTRAWSRGMLPMLTWESRPIAAQNDVVEEPEYALPRILDGAFDDYLRRYAQSIAQTGLPLAIRLDHEMNGVWYPWSERTGSGASINGNRTGDYAAMWRHVHDIFQQEGANDYVIWVWAPNRVDNLPTALQSPDYLASLYPGDDYVDWVGMSGYLRPPYGDGEDISFDATFGATLAQLRAVADKPIILAEVGASEIEGHKPAWVASFFRGLADPANDDIVGFSWFSLAVTTYVQGERATNDWRIDSRADSLAAFRDGVAALGDELHTLPIG